MERKNRNTTAVFSPLTKKKQRKTTRRGAMTSSIQMFSKTFPNVFQNFQLKLSQLSCDSVRARGYVCSSRRVSAQRDGALGHAPGWLERLFWQHKPCQNTTKTLVQKMQCFKGKLPLSSNVMEPKFHVDIWEESVDARSQMSSPLWQAFGFIPSTLGNHFSASDQNA